MIVWIVWIVWIGIRVTVDPVTVIPVIPRNRHRTWDDGYHDLGTYHTCTYHAEYLTLTRAKRNNLGHNSRVHGCDWLFAIHHDSCALRISISCEGCEVNHGDFRVVICHIKCHIISYQMSYQVHASTLQSTVLCIIVCTSIDCRYLEVPMIPLI